MKSLRELAFGSACKPLGRKKNLIVHAAYTIFLSENPKIRDEVVNRKYWNNRSARHFWQNYLKLEKIFFFEIFFG